MMSARKPKTSSFQITSVVTVGPRLNNDNGGEDSADDLDESHTDENSRVTDQENETPSFSEDTYSKEDIFFAQNAIGAAPVIPTSSQYGLALVAPEHGQTLLLPSGVVAAASQLGDVPLSVTDGGVLTAASNGGALKHPQHDEAAAVVGAAMAGELKDLTYRNERFKVVKIQSTEPFKRGRWTCVDYLDQDSVPAQSSAVQQQSQQQQPDEVPTEGAASEAPPNSQQQQQINNGEMLQPGQTAPAELYHQHQSVSPGQSMAGAVGGGAANPSSAGDIPQLPQSMPPQQLQQVLMHAQSNANSNNSQSRTGTPTNGMVDGPPAPPHQQGQSQPAQFYAQQPFVQQNQSQSPQPAFNSSSNASQQQQQQQQQGAGHQSHHHGGHHHHHHHHHHPHHGGHHHPHGATLPADFHQQIPLLLNNNHHGVGGAVSAGNSTTQSPHAAVPSSVAGVSEQLAMMLQPTGSSPHHHHQHMGTQQGHMNMGSLPAGSVGGDSNNTNSASVAAGGGNSSTNNNNMAASDKLEGGAVGGQQQQTTVEHGTVTEQQVSGGGTTRLMDEQQQQQQHQDGAAGSSNSHPNEDNQSSNDDNESASGTSAVAIDNKIEQAMDLVKSHLMFAVREEVEVLKEKIAELMDRINQLEVENTILKANASQDTLSQLSAQKSPNPQAATNVNNNNNNNNNTHNNASTTTPNNPTTNISNNNNNANVSNAGGNQGSNLNNNNMSSAAGTGSSVGQAGVVGVVPGGGQQGTGGNNNASSATAGGGGAGGV